MGIFNSIKSFVSKQSQKAVDSMPEWLRPFSLLQQNTSVLAIPRYRWPTYQIYELAYYSDTLTTIQSALRKEVFRNGIDLVEASKADADVNTREEVVEDTDFEKKKEILKFLDKVNANGQSIIEVCEELEDDLNIVDDAFMVFIMDYAFNNNGEIIMEKSELKEVVRGDPRTLGFVMNSQDIPGFDDHGMELVACPKCRDNLITVKPDEKYYCRQCGSLALRAYFFHDAQKGKIFYFRDEVVHISKFRPSKRQGFPPVIAVWQKVNTLLAQDRYMMTYYNGQRNPKGLLVFSTSNQRTAEKAWSEAKEAATKNPHVPPALAIENSNGNRGEFVKFVNFMNNLEEMQYTETRNEMRRQIGAVYGVMPLWQGDMSNSGGLNNEGLQVTVSNRAVESDQKRFNEKIFPHLLKMMGVDGWILTLNPSEEQDEMAVLQRQQLSLANGKEALTMGLEAEYDDDTDKVIIHSGNLVESANQFGNSFSEEETGSKEIQDFIGKPPLEGISKAIMKEEKIPLKPNEKPPHGEKVIQGPKGGRYYIPNHSTNEEEIGNDKYDLSRLDSNVREDAEFLIEELKDVGTEIDSRGFVKVYHRTSPENAKKIKETGKMMGSEDGLFFGTKKDGQAEGFGSEILVFRIPIEKLQLDDVFDDEAHVRIPVKTGTLNDVSPYLKNKSYKLKNKLGSLGEKSGEDENSSRLLTPLTLKSFPDLSFPDITLETIAKARLRVPFTSLSKKIQKEVEKILKSMGEKPTPANIREAIGKLDKQFSLSVKEAIAKHFKKTYSAAMDDVGKDLGINLTFDSVDQNALNFLEGQKTLGEAINGMTSKTSTALNKIFTDAFINNSLDVNKISEKVKEVADVSDFHAETIARTETAKVTSAARRISYQKEDENDDFLFKWIGPNDYRTTGTSKRIKERTKGGVSWDDLVKIVSEESVKDFPQWEVNPVAPVSHYNSRHTFVRVPGLSKSHKAFVNEQLDLMKTKREMAVLNEKRDLIKKLSSEMNGGA